MASKTKASPPGTGQLAQDLAVEWRPITEVRPYPNNPRQNAQAIADVRDSLLAFGWQQPLVLDQAGVIIVGHTRYYAALDLQQRRVPAYVAALDEAQAMAYRLADNKTGERAEWDFPKLRGELSRLEELHIPLSLTGFREGEIAALLAPLPEPKIRAFDESAADHVRMVTCPKCDHEFPL